MSLKWTPITLTRQWAQYFSYSPTLALNEPLEKGPPRQGGFKFIRLSFLHIHILYCTYTVRNFSEHGKLGFYAVQKSAKSAKNLGSERKGKGRKPQIVDSTTIDNIGERKK